MRFPIGLSVVDQRDIPPGLAVFSENLGGGAREFGVSVMMNLAKEHPDVKLRYYSVTELEDEVWSKVRNYFPEARAEEVLKGLKIKSFSESYFRRSIVPLRWLGLSSAGSLTGRKDVLKEISEAFEDVEDNSFVFFDSLTDLVRLVGVEMEWKDLIDFLKGLRKVCRRSDSIFAFHYTLNASREREDELLDQFDIVIDFELSYEKGELKRWMFFRKFVGVMPFLEREKVSRFEVSLDPFVGVVISKVHRVI